MSQKKLIPFINAENEMPGSVISLADRYACEGADRQLHQKFLSKYYIVCGGGCE